MQVRGIRDAQLVLDRDTLRVTNGAVLDLPVSVRADEAHLDARSVPIEFVLSATGDENLAVVEEARFLGPAR